MSPFPRLALRTTLVASVAAVSLAGGYGLGLRDGQTGPRALNPPAPPANISPAEQKAFGVVWETLAQLERDYYQPERLDPAVLAAGAAKGMVAAVGDPYTTISTPTQGDLLTAQLRGSFDGIGVELDRRDGTLRVVSPLAGGPAARAGVQAGDVLAAVDGEAVGALSVDEVSTRIRGPKGSAVRLGLERDGAALDVDVVRDTIKIESVRGRLLDGPEPLAYVRISTFAEPTARQLRETLGPLLAQGARGVVLDLRGNPGGYLTSAVDVTSVFLKDGVVLSQARGGAEPKVFRTTGSPQVPDLPVAVLVDRGSASAAEIVAAALHDNQRAVLIGEQTFGKGTVQEVHRLSDASQLKVTVAQWLTPSGLVIQGQGLVPDVPVAAGEGDPVLQAARAALARG
jgi:carboxyl-terminal processing protease